MCLMQDQQCLGSKTNMWELFRYMLWTSMHICSTIWVYGTTTVAENAILVPYGTVWRNGPSVSALGALLAHNTYIKTSNKLPCWSGTSIVFISFDLHSILQFVCHFELISKWFYQEELCQLEETIFIRVTIRNKDPGTRLIRARMPNVIELPSGKAYVSIPRYQDTHMDQSQKGSQV